MNIDKKQLRQLLIGDFSFFRLIRSIIFIYVCIGLYVFFFADGLIFKPQPASYEPSKDFVDLTTSDGTQITALYLPHPQAKYTILFSHGNAEDLGDLRPFLQKLHQMGFAVFAYDYHGYGTSKGTPSEQNVYQDINAAYNYLHQKLGISANQIIIYGRSVGSGPSLELASRQPVAGLILESAFITAFRVLTRIPIFPFDKFRNIDKIKQFHGPVLIMHGTVDEVVPFWHAETLFATANEPKLFVPIAGAGHNNLVEVAGDRYVQAIKKFGALLGRQTSIH